MSDAKSPPEWFALDNAAKIFPANYTDVAPEVFRVGATLASPVVFSAMQRALERTVARCPYYQVHLRRGLFWYYLERHEEPPRLEMLQSAPVSRIRMRERDEQLFRVFVKERRVCIDFSHVLTDGYGAFRFLCTLLAEYLRQRGTAVPSGGLILDPDEPPRREEFVDSYRDLYERSVPKPEKMLPAYHIPGQMRPHYHRTLVGRVGADAIRTAAKRYDATITAFLSGVYMYAIYQIQQADRRPLGRRYNLRLEVPVNMRRLHPSETMRNFSLFVIPGIDLRLGAYTLADMIRSVHHTLKLQVNARELRRQIARNVGGEMNPVVRAIPLLLKDWYLSSLHHRLGSFLYSGVISNIGNVELPPEMAPHVADFSFVLGPNVGLRKAVSVVGYKGMLNITIGSVIESRELEKLFFRTLADEAPPVSVTEYGP
jgi:NRPS condensation-like uncharacterized protein